MITPGRSVNDNFDSEDGYYSAIGRFIANFSHIEMVLKLWIAESIQLAEEHRDTIISHDFAMLCTIAQKVLPIGMDDAAEKYLKPIIKKMRDLNDHRVRIVHGWWIIGGRVSSLHHVSRGQLTSTTHYQTPGEIAALADKALDLDLELREWHRTHRKPKNT
jgi:hypothetical protein